MNWHDASRPRLGNGVPCWLGTATALPDVTFSPADTDGRWLAQVWVARHYDSGIGAHQQWVEIPAGQVVELLSDWWAGPEEALRRWWGCEPPTAAATKPSGEIVSQAGGSAEELGL
jgi:hypothetical protein